MAQQATAGTSWPVFRSLAAYRPAFLPSDVIAGLTLAAIAIPEQMATARLGGFAPQLGFFAFLAGSLAFAAFGSNRFLSCGADSTITPIFAGSLALLTGALPEAGELIATGDRIACNRSDHRSRHDHSGFTGTCRACQLGEVGEPVVEAPIACA